MIRDSVIDWKELSDLYERADVLDDPGLAAFIEELRAQKHRLLPQLERMLNAPLTHRHRLVPRVPAADRDDAEGHRTPSGPKAAGSAPIG